MCGIAGVLFFDGYENKCDDQIRAMSKSMTNRGPDDEGFYFLPVGEKKGIFFDTEHSHRSNIERPLLPDNYNNNLKLAFAHRRLSIVAPGATGKQPISSANGRYCMVFNGEIYNYKEIAKELIKNNIKFDPRSDSEVLIEAYAFWRESILEKLNGMFAFAIWDHHQKTLFCARDRIGIKPFYYTIQKNKFIFASDIKTLLSSGYIDRKPDITNLYHSYSQGITPNPLTAFKGILSLSPGNFISIATNGDINSKNYWKIPTNKINKYQSIDEACESFIEIFNKSIALRSISEVDVALFLSGGIDSSLIASCMPKSNNNVKTLTLCFKGYGEKYDESKFAKETATRFNIENIAINVSPEDLYHNIEDIVECYEEPYHTLAPNYLICNAAKNIGSKVVLNGLGGDELFGGYGYYFWKEQWRYSRKYRRTFNLFNKFTEKYNNNAMLANIENESLIALVGQSVFTPQEQNLVFNEEFRPDISTFDLYSNLYLDENMHFSDEVQAISYMNLRSYIGNHHVNRVDRFSMRFSLEARFPFLDHNLVEFAMQLPKEYKINQNINKYLLKNIATRKLPESINKNEKKGFSIPLNKWMNNQLREFVEDNLLSLENRPMFSNDGIRKLKQKWLKGQLSAHKIWLLVMTEIWMQVYFGNA